MTDQPHRDAHVHVVEITSDVLGAGHSRRITVDGVDIPGVHGVTAELPAYGPAKITVDLRAFDLIVRLVEAVVEVQPGAAAALQALGWTPPPAAQPEPPPGDVGRHATEGESEPTPLWRQRIVGVPYADLADVPLGGVIRGNRTTGRQHFWPEYAGRVPLQPDTDGLKLYGQDWKVVAGGDGAVSEETRCPWAHLNHKRCLRPAGHTGPHHITEPPPCTFSYSFGNHNREPCCLGADHPGAHRTTGGMWFTAAPISDAPPIAVHTEVTPDPEGLTSGE